MKVLVAEKCGFCLGVKNAINMAEQTLAERDVVYSLGSIIHNQDVVNELASNGLETVEFVDEIESGTVLIRSHGATKEQLQAIKQKDLDVVDATCVLVKRLQKIVQLLNKDGYKVAMIGDEDHPEVQAIVGFSTNIVVIGSAEDIKKLSSHEKLGVICQTTQTPEYFGEMLASIVKKGFSELKVINTLCKEAIKRQESAVKLCREVDIMFVLGGLHSANTRKLAELCKKYNNQTFHLQNWAELDKTLLCGKGVAGVTAGASTPDRVIREFIANLEAYKSSEK